ncbi:hypothetical protein [Trinickia sp.]|uniref:hypothetical protein n=1 Tax=Trinickia sp. TaxID=2571163 RepID=UPI003F822397
MSRSVRTVLAACASTAVVAAVVAGLFLAGSPAEERLRRFDARRLADLQSISRAVDRYWGQHSTLPSSLDALTQDRAMRLNLHDPQSGAPYEYRPGAGNAYSVCATFARDAENGAAQGQAWAYASGRYCFPREARSAR